MAFANMRDRLIYLAVWFACLGPFAWVVGQVVLGYGGANPIEYLMHQLGVWGLRLLVVGLAITPAAKLLKQPRLIRYRRTIGLWAFTYVVLHLSTYVVLDHFFDWPTIIKDIVKRPYITFGMIAVVLLIPLAVTSTDGMLRRLGPKTWKRIHQAVYVIVPLGVLHYFLLVKKDTDPPLVYGGIVAVLLGYRVWAWLRSKQERARKAAARTAAKPAQ